MSCPRLPATLAALLVGVLASSTRVAAAEADDRTNNPPQQQKTGVDGHGDPLPADALVRLGTARFRGNSEMLAVAVAGDGKLLAWAGYGPSIYLLDAASGRQLRELRGQAASALAFAPDGKMLASAGKTVRLWDVASGAQRFSLEGTHPVTSVAFSPDGTRLASGYLDGSVCIWDVRSGGKERQLKDSGPVSAVAFSADGMTLAVAGRDQTIVLWEPATARKLGHFEGHKAPVAAIAFSPNGKTLLSGSQQPFDVRSVLSSTSGGVPKPFLDRDASIRLWDVATKKSRAIAGPKNGVRALAFAPDGKSVAVAGMDKTLHVYDAATGRDLWHQKAHLAWVQAVAYGADGKMLVTGGLDGGLRWWDAATGSLSRPYPGHSGTVAALAFAPNGKSVATASWDQRIHLWDAVTGKKRAVLDDHEGGVMSLDFSPDGSLLASASEDRTVRLWDVATGKQRARLVGHEDFVLAVGFAADGKTVVSGGVDKSIRIWDVAGGRQLASHPVTAQTRIVAMAVSPGAKLVALINLESMPADTSVIRIFETDTGKQVHKLAAKEIPCNCLVFSPDADRLAAGGYSGTIGLWELGTSKPPRVLKHPAGVAALAFAPDGRTLASGGPDPGLRLWEWDSGRERQRYVGSPRAFALAFAPDGKRLASGFFDTTALVWDMTGGRLSHPAPTSPARLEAQWLDLQSDDAAKAYQALWELAAAPEQAVPIISKHMWTATAADVKAIAGLIKELDSDRFALREQARRALEKFGVQAGAQLRQALTNNPSLEVQRRVAALLTRLEAEPLTGELLGTLRAIEVLEHCGTPAARQALATLVLQAPHVRVAEQAQAALRRLSRAACASRTSS